MSIDFSCDQHMLETECPTSEERRKVSLWRRKVSLLWILFQISFYVIDLITLTLNSFIAMVTTFQNVVLSNSTQSVQQCFQVKISKSANFYKNGIPIARCIYILSQLLHNNYVTFWNNPQNSTTRGHCSQ